MKGLVPFVICLSHLSAFSSGSGTLVFCTLFLWFVILLNLGQQTCFLFCSALRRSIENGLFDKCKTSINMLFVCKELWGNFWPQMTDTTTSVLFDTAIALEEVVANGSLHAIRYRRTSVEDNLAGTWIDVYGKHDGCLKGNSLCRDLIGRTNNDWRMFLWWFLRVLSSGTRWGCYLVRLMTWGPGRPVTATYSFGPKIQSCM